MWYAVDKDGEECLFNYKPIRNVSEETWGNETYPQVQRKLHEYATIDINTRPIMEWLLGDKKLTWEDEPIEIDIINKP